MTDEELKNYFRLLDAVAQPAFILMDGYVVYRNELASKAISLGMSSASLLPGDLVEGTVAIRLFDEEFTATVRAVSKNVRFVLLKPIERQQMAMDYLSTIAKNMRTPLTDALVSARALLPEIEDLDFDDEKTIHACRIYKGLYRLERLAEHLSDGSQLLQDRFPRRVRQVELLGFFHDIANKAKSLLTENHIQFSYRGLTRPFIAAIDSHLVERAIWNLISNAVSHCTPGGKVQLRAELKAPNLIITVTNDGTLPQGVAQTLFHGYDQSPTNLGAGSGLGLGMTIIHRTATLHGGTVLVKTDPDSTAVTMTLHLEGDGGHFASATRPFAFGGELNQAIVELSDVLPLSTFHPLDLDG